METLLSLIKTSPLCREEATVWKTNNNFSVMAVKKASEKTLSVVKKAPKTFCDIFTCGEPV